MNLRFAVLSLSFATLAACGGDPGSGAISAADAEDGCRRNCEHSQECNPDPQTTVQACTAECVADVSGWVRADAFEAITDCATGLACNASEDVCLTECVPTDAHDAYEARCRAVFAACLDPGELNGICETTPVPGGDDAGFFCLITPSIVDQMTACLPEAAVCGTAIECIQRVLETNGIDD